MILKWSFCNGKHISPNLLCIFFFILFLFYFPKLWFSWFILSVVFAAVFNKKKNLLKLPGNLTRQWADTNSLRAFSIQGASTTGQDGRFFILSDKLLFSERVEMNFVQVWSTLYFILRPFFLVTEFNQILLLLAIFIQPPPLLSQSELSLPFLRQALM